MTSEGHVAQPPIGGYPPVRPPSLYMALIRPRSSSRPRLISRSRPSSRFRFFSVLLRISILIPFALSAQSAAPRDDENACILVNGRRALFQPLHSFGANAVSLVEVIREHDVDAGFTASAMQSIPAYRGQQGKHPLYF